MLSACGERIYSSTICFQRLRQSQPRKKLWTFLILAMSGSSSSSFFSSSWGLVEDLETWGKRRHSFFNAKSWKKSYVKSIQRFFFSPSTSTAARSWDTTMCSTLLSREKRMKNELLFFTGCLRVKRTPRFGKFRIFLSVRFYVKSILLNSEILKLPSLPFQRLWILLSW